MVYIQLHTDVSNQGIYTHQVGRIKLKNTEGWNQVKYMFFLSQSKVKL